MHRRLVLIGAAVVLAAGGGLAALLASRTDEPVGRAISLLARESRFDSSKEAVQSFALAYQDLVDATRRFPKDCGVRAGEGQCLALNQAAGWTLSFSPASGHCTQPAIQQGRVAILAYVRKARALADTAKVPPALPPIPRC